MPAPSKVLELVENFDRHRGAYQSSKYKETEVRREFIDPFFGALGWDVSNKQGSGPATKDVVHEYSLTAGPTKRMPDYSFRIGGDSKFFVEAKKPSVDLKEGIVPALQLRTYAWSAHLPVGVLTDFAEFAVYDCLHEPAMTDGASTARLKYFSWDEYEARWDEIESMFSRQAVLRGSLDRFEIDKRDVVSVDDAFLKEIDSWRRSLAQNMAELNPSLLQRQLNFAVQQTIDRIIFLRICEDRDIENERQLRDLAQLDEWGGSDTAYDRLGTLFLVKRADPVVGRPSAGDRLSSPSVVSILEELERVGHFAASVRPVWINFSSAAGSNRTCPPILMKSMRRSKTRFLRT
jgi:hypothetical protein